MHALSRGTMKMVWENYELLSDESLEKMKESCEISLKEIKRAIAIKNIVKLNKELKFYFHNGEIKGIVIDDQIAQNGFGAPMMKKLRYTDTYETWAVDFCQKKWLRTGDKVRVLPIDRDKRVIGSLYLICMKEALKIHHTINEIVMYLGNDKFVLVTQPREICVCNDTGRNRNIQWYKLIPC